MVSGQPKLADLLASFEAWSNFVRSTLIWLGEKDPVSSMPMSRTDDPSREACARCFPRGQNDRHRI